MQELTFDRISYLAGGKRVFLISGVDTGEHKLPALSVWAWADGKVVFRTGETPT